MSRITTRVFLGLALLAALAVICKVLTQSSSDMASIGAALAGALAVITAVVSAWGAQRVVELEEDRQKPYPYPSFDFTSRSGLVLFCINNSGGSAAHDISIEWHGESLRDSSNNEICFSNDNGKIQISVLLPDKSISKCIDGHVEFFQQTKTHRYTGTIKFKDPLGRKYSHIFEMDAHMYRETLLYFNEEMQTLVELQKIPDQLESLGSELKKISKAISAKNPANK